jgi:hypothetical protein
MTAYLCDVRQSVMEFMPTEPVDLIFTDPPYARKHLELYGWVAEFGKRVLRPGGFVLAMGGGLFTDEILRLMGQHLQHYFTFHVALTDSTSTKVFPHGRPMPIISRLKPIYAFTNGEGYPRTVVYDPFAGDGNDKRFHHWGQDLKSARYYIDCFSSPGDLVCDPFIGGGTTAVVCEALGREWIGFDQDPQAVETTNARARNPLYAASIDGQLALEFSR